LLAYNSFVFLLYAVDKRRAKRGSWRIAEATLLWLAALGGGVGGFLGVYLVRHKTRKLHFALGVPLLLAAQVGLLVWRLRP